MLLWALLLAYSGLYSVLRIVFTELENGLVPVDKYIRASLPDDSVKVSIREKTTAASNDGRCSLPEGLLRRLDWRIVYDSRIEVVVALIDGV